MTFRPKLVFCSQHYCSTFKFLKASPSSWMQELDMNHLIFNFHNFSITFGVPKLISKGRHLWIFGFLQAEKIVTQCGCRATVPHTHPPCLPVSQDYGTYDTRRCCLKPKYGLNNTRWVSDFRSVSNESIPDRPPWPLNLCSKNYILMSLQLI